MSHKKIVVCSEIKNTSWRWIAHQFPDSYQWTFCRANHAGNSIATMLFRVLASINAVIKARHADAIQSHGPYMAFYCALFLWLFRIKTPHVVYSFNFAELPTGFALKRMKFFLKNIDCLVVSSNMERALYAEYFNIAIEKIDFVRWGVSEPNFNLKQSIVNKPYISTVGGNARDYTTFMAAMAELPDIDAIAVMRPQNLIDLDVPDNVQVLVDVPKDDALSVIKNSVLTVLPLSGTETPCGHVTIVVAMYLGVPIVVTNSSGVSDYIIDLETGIMCESKSVFSMKEAIIKLISDVELSNKIAVNADVFVHENCLEKNYVDHLNQFIGN